jgi:hypothetical protein
VLGEDASAIGVDFAEGDGSHSGSFESEAEAADSAEKVEDIHWTLNYSDSNPSPLVSTAYKC